MRIPFRRGTPPCPDPSGPNDNRRPAGEDRSSTRADRRVADHGRAVQQPSASVVVVDGEMKQAAVVPNGECSWRPAESASELGLRRVIEEELQKGLGFLGS